MKNKVFFLIIITVFIQIVSYAQVPDSKKVAWGIGAGGNYYYPFIKNIMFKNINYESK
ncbi:MAG TPA: hypothetical protein PLK25_04080 [Bacteroidales bacterium]|nr:hypothetical protein [Patescibacteria group bacterium]HOF06418.1 hypothetical protein [Bacteroidales bacterium]HON96670.1 hypothetical protein [Bacteroidales bacterium]HOS19612.1 hypothetical protein [Bacteroidales bacterium]HOV55358.1 hypothetical protein [Bacteroidales bacterium]